jgi:spore germination protein GerM
MHATRAGRWRSALRALPPATRLRQAYVLENGVAYLDFSAGLKEGIGGGSMEEILAVYAIVNSIAANVPEVRKVGILVNGRVLATLNGHLDLRRPLPPDYSLILTSIIVSTGCGTWTHAA